MSRSSMRTPDCIKAYIVFMRAAESVGNRVNLPLIEGNLSVSQFGVLEALLTLGPMSQKDLAAKILKSHGNLSVVVDNLAKRELVTRTRGAVEDRRIVIVALTPEGERLVRAVLPSTIERIEREMRILTVEQLQELARMCKALGLRQKTAGPADDVQVIGRQ